MKRLSEANKELNEDGALHEEFGKNKNVFLDVISKMLEVGEKELVMKNNALHGAYMNKAIFSMLSLRRLRWMRHNCS